jgi:hypothetical protein
VAGALALDVPLDPEPDAAEPDDPELEPVLPDDPELEPVLPDDPDPEPDVAADPDPEPLVPEELVVAVEPRLDGLLVDVPAVPVLVPLLLVAVATALLCDSAGSWPDASWITITDQQATNTVATIATVRRRIRDARRLRARSRSATTRFPSRAGASGAGRWGEGESG